VMYAGRIVEAGTVRDVFRDPAHPYTKALRQSAPAATAPTGGRLLPAIPGEPPNIGLLPAGCAFRPRCRENAGRQICAEKLPQLHPVRRQSAACHFAEEV